MKHLTFFLFLFMIISCSDYQPELSLNSLFQDHMVLQRNTHAPVWGKTEPGLIVKIEGTWGEKAKVRADGDGNWKAFINTPKEGGPYTLTVRTKKSSITINDVLIGEVWLCSGQSNMEMPLMGWPPNDTINNSSAEIKNANFQNFRMFTVQKDLSFVEETDCKGEWQVCTPATAADFSATAYFFGYYLQEQLDVPIGLIHSSWGGTPAESWTSFEYLKGIKGFEKIADNIEEVKIQYKVLNEWFTKLKKIDLSEVQTENKYSEINIEGEEQFAMSNFDDSNWDSMSLPNFWESQQLNSFDGVVWFRKEFEVPENLYPEGFKLYLGAVDDMDQTYINGVKIGEIMKDKMWTVLRHYEIPSGVLKKGKNTVAVRVVDPVGGGGIYGDTHIAITKGEKEVVNLSGEWKYLPVALIKSNKVYVFGSNELSYNAMPKLPFNYDQYAPGVLYNAMISPLVNYSIKGAIWYQGESNVERGKQYQQLFPTMIKNWRDVWQNENFPFYFVQIAPFKYGLNKDDAVAEVREAQLMTMKERNTGMVVTMDIGNPVNIHPGNKQEVGRRLALWALAKNYGFEDVVYSGPIFSEATFKNDIVIVEFEYIAKGLTARGDSLTHFELAGVDGIYYPANAKIEKDKVVVTSTLVSEPIQVRYGWGDDVEPNLFNSAGLPASPFRSSK